MKLFKGITIDEDPVPDFTHNAPQCEGQAVNFNYIGTSQSSWTYHWNFGSGASPTTSFGQNPEILGAFAAIGKEMTTTKLVDLNTIVQAFNTTLARQV